MQTAAPQASAVLNDYLPPAVDLAALQPGSPAAYAAARATAAAWRRDQEALWVKQQAANYDGEMGSAPCTHPQCLGQQDGPMHASAPLP